MKNRKSLILMWGLIILTVLFTVAGIALFTITPNKDPMTTKEGLAATGCIFSFLFALLSLVGAGLIVLFGIKED